MSDIHSELRTGVVFDVQRFSLHDGAGIRTLVFVKGCSLRCLWCCNPESQSASTELTVSPARCIRCGLCAEACPHLAMALNPTGHAAPDRSRCKVCGLCVDACPSGARVLRGRAVTVDELLKEVERDMVIYRVSGGGVTVSGGEPLLQAAFVAEFLAACRQQGIHTAIETCGYAPWEDFAQVLAHTDLTLFDFKHPDTESHRRLTGVGNEAIMANLRRAVATRARIILRMPLIPEYNADADTVRAVACFARTLGISELHLIPYHDLGEAKYRSLGREYTLAGLKLMAPEHVEALRHAALENGGMTVRIGG
jgi:pyruvate formate lyase activating enzyme